MKKVRIPLTDIYWRDFMSGKIVDNKVEILQKCNINEKVNMWLKNKIKESKIEWKIFVEWLWRVNA